MDENTKNGELDSGLMDDISSNEISDYETDAVDRMQSIFGMGGPGMVVLVSRVAPSWMGTGVVQRIPWSPDITLDEYDIAQAEGGGRYHVSLRNRGRIVRGGSFTFDVPGFPKYQGETVTCENDMRRVLKKMNPESSENSSMEKLINAFLDSNARQTEAILGALKEIKSDKRVPVPAPDTLEMIDGAIKALSKVAGLANKFPGLTGQVNPDSGGSEGEDLNMNLIMGLAKEVIPVVVSSLAGIRGGNVQGGYVGNSNPGRLVPGNQGPAVRGPDQGSMPAHEEEEEDHAENAAGCGFEDTAS